MGTKFKSSEISKPAPGTEDPLRQNPPSPLAFCGQSFKQIHDTVARRYGRTVMGKSGAIWGAGLSGQLLYLVLLRLKSRVSSVFDSDSSLREQFFADGLTILPPSELSSRLESLDYIFIASSSRNATVEIGDQISRMCKLSIPILSLCSLWDRTATTATDLSLPYSEWRRHIDPPASDLRWMRRAWLKLPLKPLFQVTVKSGEDTEDMLSATIQSLRAQTYGGWSASTSNGQNRGIGRIRGRNYSKTSKTPFHYKCSLNAGTILAPHALFEFALLVNINPRLNKLTCGWDWIDDTGERMAAAPGTHLFHFGKLDSLPTKKQKAACAALQVVPPRGKSYRQVKLPIVSIPKNETISPLHRAVDREAGSGELPVILNKAPLQLLDPDQVRRILIIKLDHIGDAVLSFPVIKEVRDLYPHAEIFVLAASWTRKYFEQRLLKTGVIDKVLVFDFFREVSGKGLRDLNQVELDKLAEQLDPFDFDLAVDFRRVPDSRIVLKTIKARWKVGFGDDDTYSMLSVNGFVNTARKEHSLHIADQLRLLIAAHFRTGSGEVKGCLAETRRKIQSQTQCRLLKNLGNLPWIIGMCPGSGDALRMWPSEHYVRLADLMVKHCDAGIVLFGGKLEKPLIRKIIGRMKNPDRAVSLAGDLDLEEFTRLVPVCDLFVGNTTGPTHIAAATDTPTLNIFSGQVSPFEWAPIGAHAFVLRTKLGCSPCYLPDGQCPHKRICLTGISPDQAFLASLRILLGVHGSLKQGAGGLKLTAKR